MPGEPLRGNSAENESLEKLRLPAIEWPDRPSHSGIESALIVASCGESPGLVWLVVGCTADRSWRPPSFIPGVDEEMV